MPDGVLAAIEDDLNTPKAFAQLFALAHEANVSRDDGERRGLKQQLLAGGRLLGILDQDPETRRFLVVASGRMPLELQVESRGSAGLAISIDEPEIERLVAARSAARQSKNFAEADRIRDQLRAAGVILEDKPEGTRWSRAG